MREIIHFNLIEENELDKVAEAIIPMLRETPLVLLEGELGAGKTTLVKLIAQLLGCRETTGSPSFGLINEYPLEGEPGKIYHMDLYRINRPQELETLGIEEMLGSGCPVFIEWPQLAEPFLAEKYLKVTITVLENERIFRIFRKG